MAKAEGRLTHQERRERRRRIAAAIDEGTVELVRRVANCYGVTIDTIRQSCFEHGVPFPGRRTSKRKPRGE